MWPPRRWAWPSRWAPCTCFRALTHGLGDRDNTDRALLGLMVMVCDSARIEPVCDTIARNWDNGTELTKQLRDYRWNWPVISGALLDWRDHAYQGWPENTKLESIGITSPEDALKVAPLVFNDQDRICTRRCRPRPPYVHTAYTPVRQIILFVLYAFCCHKTTSRSSTGLSSLWCVALDWNTCWIRAQAYICQIRYLFSVFLLFFTLYK